MTEAAPPTRLEIAQRFLLHLGHRGAEESMELLSPDVSYRVPGRHALSGTFAGREKVKQHLRDLDEAARGTFEATKWEDWLVGEHYVAAVASFTANAGGRLLATRVLYLVRFDVAGLIAGIEVYFGDESSPSRFFGPPAAPDAEG